MTILPIVRLGNWQHDIGNLRIHSAIQAARNRFLTVLVSLTFASLTIYRPTISCCRLLKAGHADKAKQLPTRA
ncbi:hypothetical protein A6X21_11840 [Planctopirus hydrillae]|uniref:Uncharacterized protein n=1 Tax=Planctopirus hydrillae TaxID=1841610 RepID=A0A1C3E595_9PLAN|nr:hypothetical protein A6X21_11840 [Planctopirus hydrillae]